MRIGSLEDGDDKRRRATIHYLNVYRSGPLSSLGSRDLFWNFNERPDIIIAGTDQVGCDSLSGPCVSGGSTIG